MFRELLDAWRSRDILSQMYDELIQMLDDTEWMFRAACDALFAGKSAAELSDEVHHRSRRVSETEWKVRKQIVEHLSVRPGAHVPACLILMSVVKDADRVGDHCKNLFGVERVAGGRFPSDPYAHAFADLADDIRATFENTRRAFAEGDSDLGHAIIEHELEIDERCDQLIRRLAGDTLACRQAVAYTLTARHLKRVSAHLGNIASSVVMPIHKIDYFDDEPHQ